MVGDAVGEALGIPVVGAWVGELVGNKVGLLVGPGPRNGKSLRQKAKKRLKNVVCAATG